jgi:hypothetical protein
MKGRVVGILNLVKVAEEVLQGERTLQKLSNNAKHTITKLRSNFILTDGQTGRRTTIWIDGR